jgi:glyoxylase-like metal-dependent hydrolase (beta-lactamase superfamily II)
MEGILIGARHVSAVGWRRWGARLSAIAPRISTRRFAGEELPFWGGLEVIHLPGHTEGHCGFYSRKFDLLFSGDLFASYRFSTHLPPPFLNGCPEHFPSALRRVVELNPRFLVPNHYDDPDPAKHRVKFAGLL